MNNNTELILIRITGLDRPGLTASITEILSKYDVTILDIGQADIHSTLSLGILFKSQEKDSGNIMKELLFKASALGINIRFYPVTVEEYEEWVNMQGKNRYILTLLGRKLTAKQIAAVTGILAEQGLNIDAIKRLTGRIPLDERKANVRACIEFSVRGTPHQREEMQQALMKLSSDLEMDFSFQLDNMYNFRANIAVLMNITPDHLDRYDHCMQKYVDAKFRITQNQTSEDAFIFWNDDPIIKRELDKHGLRAHLYPFAAVKEDGAIAYVEDGEVEINEPIAFNMEQEELALHGTHNLYNSLAAGISANLAGIRKEYIRKALSDFKGVEHRLEKVATVRGVSFINDSKATNVNSCWYALQSMTGKTVLILGGKDKGNDYTEIEDLVREKCSALVYLGLHNEKLHAFFDRLGLPVADVQTGMQDAVEAAFKLAKKGETVLLSPCCASFDLFKSYEDRGDQFKACVRAL